MCSIKMKKNHVFCLLNIFIFCGFTNSVVMSAESESYTCKMKSHIVINPLGSMSRKNNTDFKLQWKGNEIILGQGGIFLNPRMRIKKILNDEIFHAENFDSDKFLARSILSFKEGKLWFTENYGDLSGITSIYAKCNKIL